MKIAYISRTTLDSEKHWDPLDLETGSICWAPKRLRGYFGQHSSAYSAATRHRRALAKSGPSTHESMGSLSSSPRSTAHSSTAKAAPTVSLNFLARSPEPATGYDRSGFKRFNPVEDSDISLLRTRGLRAPSSSTPGFCLGGLVPRTESIALGGLLPFDKRIVLGGLVHRTEHAVSGGLPLTSTAFHEFSAQEPRIWIDGFSTPPGIFVAPVSASVATAEGYIGCGSTSPSADTVFAWVFAMPMEGSTGSAEALASAAPIVQSTSLSWSSTQETDFAATTGLTLSVFGRLGTPADPLSTNAPTNGDSNR